MDNFHETLALVSCKSDSREEDMLMDVGLDMTLPNGD